MSLITRGFGSNSKLVVQGFGPPPASAVEEQEEKVFFPGRRSKLYEHLAESLYVRNEDTFVQHIEPSKSRSYDIKVGFKNGKFFAQASTKTKNKYKGKKPESISAKGNKDLVFYFTSVNDPHFLIFYIKIKLHELIKDGTVYQDAPKDLDQCSVYTLKLFDKYVRT